MKRLIFTLPILLVAGWLTSAITLAAPPVQVVQAKAPEKPAEKPKVDWSSKPRGYKPMPEAKKQALRAAAVRRNDHIMRKLVRNVTPPAVFDTAALGWSPPVVDQGSCGSCYLVSSCDAATAAWIKAGWAKADGSFKISDQFGLDCKNFGGCGGGDEAQVIDYMKTSGFPAEKYLDANGKPQSDYRAYTASPGRCQLPAGAKMWRLADYGFVSTSQNGSATIDQFKAALMTYGQLSIALDASSFSNYNGGVINNLGNSIDHAVTVTGWDDSKQAIKVRNNWGTSWGIEGYAWVSYKAVPQIVEVIWLQAPAITPPQPGPGPGPQPGPGPGPVITSNLAAAAQVGAAFSYQITASGTPTAYAADKLPDGLSVSTSTGVISGTPTTPGTSNVTIIAANSGGAGSATLVITVTAGPTPPTPGSVSITLTTDQVNSVLSQAGSEAILAELTKRLHSSKPLPADAPKPQCCLPPEKSVEQDIADIKRSLTAVMKWILAQQQK